MTNNDIIRNIILYITYIIILYIIIEEVYYITLFVFNYNSSFDYGLMLRKMCGNEYFEYETERFQLATNTINLKLKNDVYNKKTYMIMILIISIIISIIVSFIFARIFYHNFIENYICIKFDNEPNNPNAIYSTFKKVILCFCPMCGELTDCTATYIIYLFILLLIPLYILLYLAFNIDIGFFTNNDTYYYYIIFFISLIIIRFPIKYLSNIRHLNENASIFLYFLYLIVYLLSFYYIANIISIYKNYNNEYAAENSEKIDEEEKFYKYSAKNILGLSDDITVDIINNFIAKIFGVYSFKEKGDLYEGNGKFIKDFSRYIFIIGIILIIVYIMYLSLQKIEFLNFLLKREEDYNIIYNNIIIPLLSLFFVLLIINATTVYNSYVNKYILYEPLMLYKNDLDKLYKSFDIIILNDSSALEDPEPVPDKIAYGVLHVLYSAVFKYNPINGRINDIQDSRLIKDKHIALTALLLLDSDTSTDYNIIHYTTESKFNFIEYTIKQHNNRNIFYDDNNKINNKILLYILLNLLPITSAATVPTDDDYLVYGDRIKYNLKAALCNIMIIGKDATGYYNIGETGGTRIDGQPDIYINALSTNNYSITEYKDTSTPIKGSKENDIYLYNNKEKYNKLLYDYENLLENIKKEYINLIKKTYEITTDLIRQVERCEALTISQDEISKRLEDDLALCDEFVKKKYVSTLMEILETTFNNINFHLENNKKNRNLSKLSQYIISNYNNIFTDNNYINRNFIVKNTQFKINYDNENKVRIDAAATALISAEALKKSTELAKRNNIDQTSAVINRLSRASQDAYDDYIKKLKIYNDLLTPQINDSDKITSDPNFGDENRARNVSTNADRVSFGLVLVSVIYLFVLAEPFYIE